MIAEKLITIAENMQKVYEAGQATGGSGDNPLEYANDMSDTYYGITFPDGYELTMDLPNVTTFNSAFYNAKGIKKVTIKCNTAGNGVSFNRAFRNITAETIDLTEFNAVVTDCQMAFMYSRIIEILGEIDFSNCTNFSRTFEGHSALVTITPKKETIKLSVSFAQSNKLSDISIQSIIDGLVDLTPRYYVAMQTGPDTYEKGELIENVISVTEYGKDANGETIYNVEYGIALPNIFSTTAYKEGGGDAQTLTLHATVGGKLTDEQKATITAKNWELVY